MIPLPTDLATVSYSFRLQDVLQWRNVFASRTCVHENCVENNCFSVITYNSKMLIKDRIRMLESYFIRSYITYNNNPKCIALFKICNDFQSVRERVCKVSHVRVPDTSSMHIINDGTSVLKSIALCKEELMMYM